MLKKKKEKALLPKNYMINRILRVDIELEI